MDDIITSWLHERSSYLKRLIINKEAALQSAPEGSLRYTHNNQQVCYYCRSVPGKSNGQYIRKENKALAAALAQKDYDIKVIKAARQELDQINALLKYEESQKSEDIYNALSLPRRQLVTPISPSDEEFLAAWQAVTWQPKPFKDTKNEYYTGKGERVRSKSEILIADTLARFGVPYRYEYPTNIGGTVLYPDFTVLNIRKRKEFIWEHLGMLGQSAYASNAAGRIEMLEFNGYYPGENLIVTMETDDAPLNTKLVVHLIKRYLL